MLKKEKNNSNSEYLPVRNIERLYHKVQATIVAPFLEKISDPQLYCELSSAFEEKLQLLNKTYGTVKDLFKYSYRHGGERYFEHVVEVANIYLEKLSKIEQKLSKLDLQSSEGRKNAIILIHNEFTRFIIALEHDTLEDTDVDFEGLKQSSGSEIALGVALLSKPPFYQFTSRQDFESLDELKKLGILNSKLLLNDRIKLKLYLEEKAYSSEKKMLLFGSDDYCITDMERRGIEKYETLKGKYKEQRDFAYYSRFVSFTSMLEYAISLNNKYKLGFSIEKLEQISRNAIEIKIADRGHNLNDMWPLKGKPHKIEKKIKETIHKLLPIAYEVDQDGYILLKEGIIAAELVLGEIHQEIGELVHNTRSSMIDII